MGAPRLKAAIVAVTLVLNFWGWWKIGWPWYDRVRSTVEAHPEDWQTELSTRRWTVRFAEFVKERTPETAVIGVPFFSPQRRLGLEASLYFHGMIYPRGVVRVEAPDAIDPRVTHLVTDPDHELARVPGRRWTYPGRYDPDPCRGLLVVEIEPVPEGPGQGGSR